MNYNEEIVSNIDDCIGNVESMLDTLLEEKIIEMVYGKDIRNAINELRRIQDEVTEFPEAPLDVGEVQYLLIGIQDEIQDRMNEWGMR